MKLSLILALGLASIPATSFAAEITAASIEPSGDEKVVCRRIEESGSLVKSKKICKTRKDWRVARDNHRREMEQLTGGAPPRSN